MDILEARWFPINSRDDKWFAIIFEGEDNGKRFTHMSAIPLSDDKFDSLGIQFCINRKERKIPSEVANIIHQTLSSYSKHLTSITPGNPVSGVLNMLKDKIDRLELSLQDSRPPDIGPKATQEEVDSLFKQNREESERKDRESDLIERRKPVEDNESWYEKSVSHGE